MEDVVLSGLIQRTRQNLDVSKNILEKLKNVMRRRGHPRPSREIEERVNLAEVDALLEDLDDDPVL
jgi:hypothetical protein